MRSALHKLCAYPTMISWAIGAAMVVSLLLGWLSQEVSLKQILADWHMAGLLVLALIPAMLLGYVAGMVLVWPFIRPLCSRINGAPLAVGDKVEILTGPHKGRIATVDEIPLGQGGWPLSRLDMGEEHRATCGDLFETYELLRIKRADKGLAPVSGRAAPVRC